jgi:hypothetical protein
LIKIKATEKSNKQSWSQEYEHFNSAILAKVWKRYRFQTDNSMPNAAFTFRQYLYLRLNILAWVLLSASLPTHAQVALPDDPIPFKSKEFFIAEVAEERATQAIAIQGLRFNESAAAAIYQYTERNLSKAANLRPVLMGIKELKLTEKVLTGNRLSGTIQVQFSFGLQKPYGKAHLIDYQGKLQYTRSAANDIIIEKSLSNLTRSALIYFDNWIKLNAGTSRQLARQVKISFSNYSEQPEGDTIYYAADRRLIWADFQSRLQPGTRYQAMVMPGIAYEQEAAISDGTINVQIAVKAFLPKSASWASPSTRDAYSLNHEQRHFDLVKITAEQFKRKILSQHPNPDNFEAIINMQYLDTLRDLNHVQTAYDNETSHGTDSTAQAAWNDKIDKLLQSI